MINPLTALLIAFASLLFFSGHLKEFMLPIKRQREVRPEF
jgi:hypothetical protein